MSLEEFYSHCSSRRNIRLVVAIFFIAFSMAYFAWRISVLNQQAIAFSIIFLLAELNGFISIIVTMFITWNIKERHVISPPQDLDVDVFIPTYNESIDIVRTTAHAAKNILYPHKTWILDDGNRTEIKGLAEELGCMYIAREDNTHAKAGNLNNALKYSSADFIAIFDADHVPEDYFLDRLLGYFNDPDVAYVQTPQDFYNIDSFQFKNSYKRKLLWHDQLFFYQIGQAGRDFWNATTFCGTCSIIRRKALNKIGGIATDTVTEDMQTAVRLQKSGYKSVYHPETLAYGVAATSYTEFLQQRLRWGHGNVQTLREEGLPFCKGLTLSQNICYTGLGLSYFESWSRLILYLTPAVVLLSGIAPIGDTHLFFWFFIPYFLSAYICIEEFGRGSARFFVSEFMAMARFPVFLLATFGLIFKRKRFRITSKQRSEIVPVYFLVPQLLILVFNLNAFAVGIIYPPEALVLSMSGGTIQVICFWAAVNVILAMSVVYAVIQSRGISDEYQFRIQLPLVITPGSQKSIVALTKEISVKKLNFIVFSKNTLKLDDIIICNIYLNDRTITTKAIINQLRHEQSASEYTVTGDLIWDNINDRDLLNIKLRNCGWYRQFTWYGGFFKTTLESSLMLFYPAKWKSELQNNKWDPVLIRVDDENQLKFALIRPAKETDKVYINTYIDFTANTTLKIIKPGDKNNIIKEIKINNIRDIKNMDSKYINHNNILSNTFCAEIDI